MNPLTKILLRATRYLEAVEYRQRMAYVPQVAACACYRDAGERCAVCDNPSPTAPITPSRRFRRVSHARRGKKVTI